MPTLQEVKKQIAALPDRYVFYTHKEIRYLPKILNEGENILAITSGYLDSRTWLAVCTNRRVLLINRGMFFGLRQIQMNLDRIQSIDSSYTIFFGSIRLWDGANSVGINLVLKSSIAPFVKATQDAMDRYKRLMVHDIGNAVSNVGRSVVAPSMIDELERLSKLKAAGHLSETEFAAAKIKLLESAKA
jgi:hypothetical protein